MFSRDTKKNYGSVTRLLHLFLILFIGTQLLLGLFMPKITNPFWRAQAYSWHKATGLIVLAVAMLFILWRWFNQRPEWPEQMQRWARLCASAVHTLLYWLIVLMPLSGWVMATAAGYPPKLFAAVLPFPLVPLNSALSNTCGVLHVVFAWAISIFIAIHALGALKHLIINRDNLFQRMFRG